VDQKISKRRELNLSKAELISSKKNLLRRGKLGSPELSVKERKLFKRRENHLKKNKIEIWTES